MITFTHDIDKTVKAINIFERKIMPAVSSVVIGQIRSLRSKGLEADGSPSPPYVPEYARRRRAEGLQTAYVDHYVTGDYLRSIRNHNGVIRPSNDQMKKAQGLAMKRTDFDVNPATFELIEKALLRLWDAAT